MALTTLSRSIKGSVAVVTGAASGMGRATAHLFGDQGARVALVDVNRQSQWRAANDRPTGEFPALTKNGRSSP